MECDSKSIAYLVCYSSGEYDTYYVHNHCVCMSKKKAKDICKELDKLHFNLKSEFEEGEENPKSYDYIRYEYDTYIYEHDEEFETHLKYDDENFNKEQQELQNKFNRLLEDYVMKAYPDWDRKKAREQIDIQEQVEQNSYDNFSEAWIDEIELYL